MAVLQIHKARKEKNDASSFNGADLRGVLLPVAALAQTTGCAELDTLQIWAGYLSWIGFFKVLGATIFAFGVLFFAGGAIVKLIYHMRLLLEVVAYLASAALIGSGFWVPPEYLTWTVFIGCLLFMGSVFLTLYVHNIKGDDPKSLAAIFTVVWGAVAIYYNMPEVGTLTMLAIMTLLGFTVVVDRLSYGFGWHDKASIPAGNDCCLDHSRGVRVAKTARVDRAGVRAGLLVRSILDRICRRVHGALDHVEQVVHR